MSIYYERLVSGNISIWFKAHLECCFLNNIFVCIKFSLNDPVENVNDVTVLSNPDIYILIFFATYTDRLFIVQGQRFVGNWIMFL